LLTSTKNLNKVDQKQWIGKPRNKICLGNSNVFYSALWNKANVSHRPP